MRTILLRPAPASVAVTYHTTEHNGPHCEASFVNDDQSLTVCSLDPDHPTQWHLSIGTETGTWFQVLVNNNMVPFNGRTISAVREPVSS